MKIAYADPPYLGLAEKFYGEQHPEAAAYDDPATHAALFERLRDEFDGWAYSLHSPSLRVLLPLAPEGTRVAAWCKPFASFKNGVNPAYAWEPVLFWPARGWKDRPLPAQGGTRTTTRDYLSEPILMRRGFQGAKPDAFCRWVFDLIGARWDDDFHDLFPGSGAVGEAWTRFTMSFDREILF